MKNTELDTRQKLIDATFEAIYSHGYQGASLAEILAQAGVHKGSMYHFFANKKTMALTAIEEKLSARAFERYGRILLQHDNYLSRLFESWRDTSLRDFDRGCPLANIVQEMSNIDDDFNRTMKLAYAQFHHQIEQVFDRAIQAGEMKTCDTRKLAVFSAAVIEGAILATKASGNVDDYLDAINQLIEHVRSKAVSSLA
ncbi:MAG: TetR/AcrR family transcriptional regulator [Proteobacteria bacterium]|nr:TetR/AcrR family transcriptional regulator [Pseudomonadota bacterium]